MKLAAVSRRFASLANILGPIIGGILFDIDVNYPYYFATIVLVFGVLLTLIWKKPATI